ncbi:protein zwilch homolog [Eriocheir sinensis]|uniref:protein zwilch homolog n=1 Tax=Eriocheir sinensis TaxID=95602 RepID=UPI0021C98323|nr:protein zwilch homolog [Eriocheir sinensis]
MTMQDIKEEIRGVLSRLLQRKTEDGEALAVGEEQVVISRQQCPAVLLSANKNLPEILLVEKFTQHKRLCSSTSTTCSTPVSKRNGHTPHTDGLQYGATDLDVTGSPLKCPFMQDNEDLSPFTIALNPSSGKKKGKASLTYIPIPSAKAILIASKLNLALCKLPEQAEFVPLWVVCDGKDAQGTLFVGIHREKDTHSRTLVTSGGPYHDIDTLPSLDHLMRHHMAVGPTKRVDTAVEATYSVLPSEDEVRSSSVSLTCTWKRPLIVLSSPAPDASTIANVHVECGDPRSAAHQMYLELSVLRGFVNGMETGEVSWFVRENSRTMAEELEDVFSSIKEKGARAKREDEGGFDFDMMIEGQFFNWRQNMDFTDRLWSILMRCESYQELQDGLNFVFKAVAGEEIRPQIHARNTTQVGCLLRNLMRGQGGLPELTGLTPLHMLVEMGCEKIKRDYINIFQAGELVTGEQLAWFVRGEAAAGGAGSNMSHVIAQLERLHVALQVVVALRTYLNLSLTSLTHFTAQVLNQMKEEQPTSNHSFSLKLDTLSVHAQFESMKEDTWEVSLHSQEGSYSKLLVCHFSHTPLIQLPSNDSEFDEVVEGEVKEKEEYEDEYFCTFFSSVTDKLLQQ